MQVPWNLITWQAILFLLCQLFQQFVSFPFTSSCTRGKHYLVYFGTFVLVRLVYEDCLLAELQGLLGMVQGAMHHSANSFLRRHQAWQIWNAFLLWRALQLLMPQWPEETPINSKSYSQHYLCPKKAVDAHFNFNFTLTRWAIYAIGLLQIMP